MDLDFVTGESCWKTVQSERTALIIDGANYFKIVREAIAAARHSILILGWEINTHTPLSFGDGANAPKKDRLEHILKSAVGAQPALVVHVLDWDAPPFYGGDRQKLVGVRLAWLSPRRIRFAFDRAHPVGASHHQKVVVIDDCLAFVGGLDLTFGRSDTSEHLPDDPRRTNPDGSTYGPFHDVMLAVAGDAAAALGDLARLRWLWATGETLEPPPKRQGLIWPNGLEVDFTDHRLAVARTLPAWRERPQSREIERLYIREIDAARDSIYIENQYLTANRVAAALARSLQQRDGPEIILVIPRDSTDWLERTSMTRRRQKILAQLQERDRFERLRVYHPVVGDDGSCAVKVHAKLMIVDGKTLHIGSANLNNRSMGLDSECDVATQFATGSDGAKRVQSLCARLLGEHLGRRPQDVADALAENDGSLIAAIEALRGGGRTLVPYAPEPMDDFVPLPVDDDLLDPHAPSDFERSADRLIWKQGNGHNFRKRLFGLIATVTVLAALAVAWRWGPLGDSVDVTQIDTLSQTFASRWLKLGFGFFAFLVAALLMAPVTALIFAAGFFYGPLWGFGLAYSGSLIATTLGYLIGLALGKPVLDRFAGSRLESLNQSLARRGIITSVIVRLLPVAPFAFVNMAAGASRISFRDFIVGTALGMLPGTLLLTLFSAQIHQAAQSPDFANIGFLMAILAVAAVAIYWVWRRFVRTADD